MDRPGNTALLYGLFQSLYQAHQAGNRLRSLLAAGGLDTALLSELPDRRPVSLDVRPQST